MIGGTAGPPGYGVLDILHRDAATGDLTEVACLSSDGTDGQTGASQACLPTPGLLGGGAVAVSPDGTTVYTGSSASAAILAFRRDPATGLLSRIGCFRLTPPLGSGCSAANVFGGIDALAVSPDGQGLYSGSGVGGPTPGSTTALSVLTAGLVSTATSTSTSSTATGTTASTATSASTSSSTSASSSASASTSTTTSATTTTTPTVASIFGVLPAGVPLVNPCLATGGVDGACANATSTMGISSLAMSADGRFLYATADSSDAVDTFARSASGLLTQTGCLMNTPPPGPCTASPFVSRPSDIALSADGRSAYVVDDGTLVVATRTPGTGAVTEVSCIDSGASADSGSDTSTDTTSTDSGSDSSSSASTDTTTTSTSTSSTDSCSTAPGVSAVASVAVSPDGASVYATNVDEGGLVAFTRDPTTGALTESSCAASADYLANNSSSPCVQTPGSDGSYLVVSPDGRNVYALDPTANALYGYGPAATAKGARLAAGGRAVLRITCPRVSRSLCVGRVQLALPTHAKRAARRRSHAATISSAGLYRLAPGRTARVEVRLPRAIRLALRHRHGHQLALLAKLTPVPGGGGAAARVIDLH